ncbi:hypothetical protein [Paraburkholderia acidiphila]|uniref:Uncharacterized protein n=1 Tax=Paraburkholderia acidiphila TaxID=2571747 RepID=A0A7Z2G8I2_9BURK|nr:hypothetical protein [Paraburkholderia acidiphila]QGZ57029.1 hypothetical protein FAZ97_18985 [Paraburkholderia acidiphila]
MPLVFSNIKTDWDNAKNAGGILPVAATYGDATDDGGTMIYLPFTFQNESYHISVPLASGGVANSCHVTAERPTPVHLDTSKGKKAGTTYTVKNKPTAYYDFVISGGVPPNVVFSHTSKVEIIGKKTQKVFSASFATALTNAVQDIMRAFALHMLGLGTSHATPG